MPPPKPPALLKQVGLREKIRGRAVGPLKLHSKTEVGRLGEDGIFDLPEGVLYISMPVIPPDPSPAAVFGPDVNLREFDLATQAWVIPSVLECTKGYYLYCPKARVVTITGIDCVVTIDDLIAIYNSLAIGEYALVGPGITTIDIAGTVLESRVLGFDYDTRDFVPVTILNPQEGYWIGKGVTITFVTKNQDGTELNGVSVYIDEAYKGVT